MAVATNASFIAKRLLHRLAQANAHVLDRVMLIDLQVALRLDLQIERPMPSEQLQHVIQKPDARLPPPGPTAVEIQLQLDLRLASLAIDFCCTRHWERF